ncbi:hypothetical protein MMC27_003214 [Xylographa pallens]|nr:hypothetical protein [Xylographa pallens]
MLLSFLFSLLHFLLLAQAARKPRKGRQTTSTIATVIPSARRIISVDATAILPPPPSTTDAAAPPLFSDSPTDLFDETDLTGKIVCQSKTRFSVLHRPDCQLSAEQIHSPTQRGPGINIPPTSPASSYRFSGFRGHCEIYITATYVVSVARSGVPTLWDPSEIEWIQMWIHVRSKVDMIINSCVGYPGASAEELRNVHGGRGGASTLLMDGDRLSSRVLVSDRTNPNEAPPPAIQFEILVHDGKDLASLRDQARALGILRDRGL